MLTCLVFGCLGLLFWLIWLLLVGIACVVFGLGLWRIVSCCYVIVCVFWLVFLRFRFELFDDCCFVVYFVIIACFNIDEGFGLLWFSWFVFIVWFVVLNALFAILRLELLIVLVCVCLVWVWLWCLFMWLLVLWILVFLMDNSVVTYLHLSCSDFYLFVGILYL